MLIWSLNAGSTGLKAQLIELAEDSANARGNLKPFENVVAKSKIRRIGSNPRMSFQSVDTNIREAPVDSVYNMESAVDKLLDLLLHHRVIGDIDEISACAFKTVHTANAIEVEHAVQITPELLEQMRKYNSVAPAHNPPYLSLIEACRALMPKTPMIAVFEFLFHRTIPTKAYLYGIPYDWLKRYGIRRFGFHGASHQYVSERVAELHQELSDLSACDAQAGMRLINVHLGGSASVCAIKNGLSVDTSMGFSPQSGILNLTRTGELDPFVVLWLLENTEMSTVDLRNALCNCSGLAGISGVTSGNIVQIRKNAQAGDEHANIALETWTYGIQKTIGGYVPALGGIDLLTFSGGIGEHEPEIRKKICQGLRPFGVELDERKNQKAHTESAISSDDSEVKVMVIPTHEELIVARRALRCLLLT